MSTPTAHEAVVPRARRRSSRRNPVAPYLFLAPGMILFALCVLYPMVRSGQMSFYDWNIVKGSNSDFVGLTTTSRPSMTHPFGRGSVTPGSTWL